MWGTNKFMSERAITDQRRQGIPGEEEEEKEDNESREAQAGSPVT